ncbi:hypothetical protein BDZ94DRAFT_1265610 [Collybia nuda]|uniref:Uncharacterized protein n=1 Tax=Collybia nuda TaxID=64659 RepID=A0A9P5Y1T3_9AGAR|nr:hypothetical protein BDZ94DRAFT_1265610 [Collybia nuda]
MEKPEDRNWWALSIFGAVMEYFPYWTIVRTGCLLAEALPYLTCHDLKISFSL